MKFTTEVEAFKWTGDETQIDDPQWIIEAIRNRKVSIQTSQSIGLHDATEVEVFDYDNVIMTTDIDEEV